MPPCHGGDRRFESGRARHEKRLGLYVVVFSHDERLARIFETVVRRSRAARRAEVAQPQSGRARQIDL